MNQIISRVGNSKLKQQSRYFATEVKKELSDKEKKENARWAMGFFGVIMAANCFTVWQEWDALTVKKDVVKHIDTSKDILDTSSNDFEPRHPKYGY
jgi:hypothetical protein